MTQIEYLQLTSLAPIAIRRFSIMILSQEALKVPSISDRHASCLRPLSHGLCIPLPFESWKRLLTHKTPFSSLFAQEENRVR